MPAINVSYGPARGMAIDPRLRKKAIDPTTGMPLEDAVPTAINPTGSTLQSLQTQPVFNNDAERIIAINSGQFDPTQPIPLQRVLSESIGADRARTQDALVATRTQQHPLESATTPAEILASQLAADKDGTIKKIIQSTQGLDPNQVGPTDALKPYIGHVAPNVHGVDAASPLDYDLLHHPEFAKAYAKDPKEGMRIYRALTGRDMIADHKATKDLVDHRVNFENSFFEKNITNGAERDTTTGQWKLPALTETEPNSMSLGSQTPRLTKQFRPATKFENDIMERLYPTYDPKGFQKPPMFGSLMNRNAQAFKQRAATDPALMKTLNALKAAKGSELNPEEMLRAVTQHDEQQAAQGLADAPATNIYGYGVGPSSVAGANSIGDLGAWIANKWKTIGRQAKPSLMYDEHAKILNE